MLDSVTIEFKVYSRDRFGVKTKQPFAVKSTMKPDDLRRALLRLAYMGDEDLRMLIAGKRWDSQAAIPPIEPLGIKRYR